MNSKMILHIILFSLAYKSAFSANILFISPIESVSHHIWNEVLIGGLLKNGHNITLMGHSDAKIKSHNYTVYKLTGTEEIYTDTSALQSSPIMNLIAFWKYTMMYVEPHLKSNALKTILDYPKDKFDLIIFDLVYGQEFYPLIEYFGNPPVVGISPFSLPPYILDAMGSHFYYYYPIFYLTYTDQMTFLQRMENTLMYISDYVIKWYYMPIIFKMAQKRYGEHITSFDQMERKIGILLANYDPVLEYPQPLPPNIISVGGMHVKRSEPLPDDLLKILDNASDGVIYFAFGTIVQPSMLPEEKKRIFLNVFSKLNQTILWKYPADDLKHIPKNVVIRKWYPQNDILAHENIKLFITHGGGLSAHETMNHGVPILGIPFFVDQQRTAGRMEAKLLGKKLQIGELTEEILHETILELLSNPIYKQNMKKISRLYRDQKDSPLERALFWIEYALRNKDLSHLYTKARYMTLFQRENLDVFGIIFMFIIAFLVILLLVTKYVFKCLILKRKPKVKQN